MNIRRLAIGNYEKITGLWTKAGLPFKPKGRDSKEAIAAQMKANPPFFIGAFEGDQLVGVVIISCDVRRGWINRLAVDPNHRGRGIAKALVAEAEKVLRSQGIRIFCVQIEAENTESRELFRKCGYREHPDIVYLSKRQNKNV